MTPSPAWPVGRPRALGFLPRFLFADGVSAWRYVLLAWPIVTLPALALAWVASRLAPTLAGPELEAGPWWLSFIGVVVVSPFMETLLMVGLVSLIDRWRGPVVAVLGSAVVWAVLHSLFAARWGLVVWWPFLLFSIAFVTWRGRGFWPAVGVVTTIHVLQNLLPMLALLVLD